MLKPGIDYEKPYRATFIRQYGLCCCNMALVSFRLFCKNLGYLREFFGQMVYPPPPRQKISRTPMHRGLFTVGALENLDHNPSSTASQSSFHGTGISMF